MAHATAAVDDWYHGTSPQWSEIFSPFPDAASFMAQFDDGGLGLTEFPGIDFSSQSGTSSANLSFASDGLSTQSQPRQCGSCCKDHACESGQPPQSDCARMHADDSSSSGSSYASDKHTLCISGSPSLARKIPIQPVARPFERPKRTKKTRQLCTVQECGQDFACAYDLTRHLHDVHSQGNWIYKCSEPACGYVRPRKDKVKDHCTKRMHCGFSTLFVGNGRNAEELETMIEQRRKKGKRRSVCDGCGRSADPC